MKKTTFLIRLVAIVIVTAVSFVQPAEADIMQCLNYIRNCGDVCAFSGCDFEAGCNPYYCYCIC